MKNSSQSTLKNYSKMAKNHSQLLKKYLKTRHMPLVVFYTLYLFFLSILNTLGMFLKCGVFEERTTHALLCILNFLLSSSSSRNFVMNFPGAYSISVNYILSWSSWVVIVYQHNIPVFNKGLIWSHKSIYKMNKIKKKMWILWQIIFFSWRFEEAHPNIFYFFMWYLVFWLVIFD